MTRLDIPENIIKLTKKKGKQLCDLVKTPPSDIFEVGQIWSTYQTLGLENQEFHTEEPRLLVILEVHQDNSFLMNAAPVSVETQFASQYDLIISKHDSPLGFDFMVEVWNETPVYEKHLRKFFGKLSNDTLQALISIYPLQKLNDPIPETLENWVGLKIFSKEDPRLAFQEEEVLAISYLTRAATLSYSLSLAASKEIENEDLISEIVFRIKPVFDKLSSFGSLVNKDWAYAASREESNTHIVTSPDAGEKFIFELQEGLPSTNEIYMLVHHISRDLEYKNCFTKLISEHLSYELPSFTLKTDIEVKTSVDPDFDILSISEVEVRIE